MISIFSTFPTLNNSQALKEIIIRTPDIKIICSKLFYLASTKKIPWKRLSKILYGKQDYKYNFHMNCFSFEWLKEELEKCNMHKITKNNKNYNMIVKAVKK